MTPTFPLQAEISRLLTVQANAPTHNNVVGIGRSLTTSANMTIFEALVREIEKFSSGEVHDMTALRQRENKKVKGNAWELFCKEWLLNLPSQTYSSVWLLSEVPDDVLALLSIKRVDSGIDLVCQLRNVNHAPTEKCGFSMASAFIPVQCKFRGRTKLGRERPLQWEMVNSFVGLVSLTGPWRPGLIMTNTTGFGRKSVPVANRFRTLAKRSFCATKHDQWCRMAGLTKEYRLGEGDDPILDDEDEPSPMRQPILVKAPALPMPTVNIMPVAPLPPAIQVTTVKSKAKGKPRAKPGHILDPVHKPTVNPDQMREARLRRFEVKPK
jgi:hypothetical protein